MKSIIKKTIITQTSIKNNQTLFDNYKTLKEITIQDILNNMQEVIEVGDTVCLKRYPNEDTYEVTGFTGSRVHLINLGTWVGSIKGEKGHDDIGGLKLVSKGKKKEVIGYETVVDLPGIPKGSKSAVLTISSASFLVSAGVYSSFFEEQLKDTKFFKPIYKAESIDLTLDKHKATLSKEEGLVFSDGEKLSLDNLKKLLKALQKTVKVGTFGDFGVTVDVEYKTIKVGCKSFTPTDVKTVEEAIKTLEK